MRQILPNDESDTMQTETDPAILNLSNLNSFHEAAGLGWVGGEEISAGGNKERSESECDWTGGWRMTQ